MQNILNSLYPNRIQIPMSIKDFIPNKYYVYILTLDNRPIVVGHGKQNRAKIIFDDIDHITSNWNDPYNLDTYQFSKNLTL